MAIDIIAFVVFAYGFWQGYSRGIIRTIFNVLSYVLGIVVAFRMAPVMQTMLERVFNSNNAMMFLAAFVVNLLIIMFIMRMLARGMEGIFQMAYLGIVNQLLGGVVSGFIGLLIFSILLWFGKQADVIGPMTVRDSRVYPFLEPLPPQALRMANKLRPFGKEMWDTSKGLMNNMEKFGVEKTETKPKLYEVPDRGQTNFDEEPETNSPIQRPNRYSPPGADEGDGIEDE